MLKLSEKAGYFQSNSCSRRWPRRSGRSSCAVRKAANGKGAGYPDDLVGISLMRKAFHPETGPLTAMSLVIAEREAEMHLFSGAIGHTKNPTSHRDVILAPQQAARLVVFASHLLGIIEQRLG